MTNQHACMHVLFKAQRGEPFVEMLSFLLFSFFFIFFSSFFGKPARKTAKPALRTPKPANKQPYRHLKRKSDQKGENRR